MTEMTTLQDKAKEGVDQETVDAVAQLSGTYKHGWNTEIEMDFAPKGLTEDIVRLISERNDEPQWMLDFRLEAFARWQKMEEPDWSMLRYAPVDYQEQYYYAKPASMTEKPKSLDDVDPKLLETYEKLGIPLKEQMVLAGVEGADEAPAEAKDGERKVAVDAVFDSVSVGTTFKKELEKAGVIFCSISEAIREHPELVKKYLASVVPTQDNYDPELGRLQRRVLRLHPAGHALPDGAEHLFPHQCREYRPVRADADHRRRRQLCQLPGRLHRPHARHQPAARGRGGDRGAGRCRGEVFDRPELVSGRRERQGRHLQLRHQARRLPRCAVEGQLDPG